MKTFAFGSLLIESPKHETEDQFRAYVTELLAEIYGTLPEWLVFNIGRRYERQGEFYREFLCPAGSVDGRVQMRAGQQGGISRPIIIHGTRGELPFCAEIRSGVETEFLT